MSLASYLKKKTGREMLEKGTWRLRPTVLLCEPVPKPMNGVAPRVVLGRKWWDETRKAACLSTDDHCIACGVWKGAALFHRWLEGHEVYQIDHLMGRMVYVETVPLCNACHSFIHLNRLMAMLRKKKVTQIKFDLIVRHGESVLRKAKLQRAELYDGPMAEWKKWRLVVNGKEYPPLYKNEKEWAAKHED